MKKNIIMAGLVMVLAGGIVGCNNLNLFSSAPKKQKTQTKAPAYSGPVVAKVNGTPITVQQLDDEIANINALLEGSGRSDSKITTKEQKINFVRNYLVRQELLYQEARRKGLDRDTTIRRAMDMFEQRLLIEKVTADIIGQIDVTSKEVEDAYNTIKDQLPDESQIREIVVATESEAKEVLIQLLQGQDFASIAGQRSVVESKKTGGDLGYIAPGKKSPEFDKAAFSESLQVGQTSSIFKTPEGYSIIKLEAKRKQPVQPLSEIFDQIKELIKMQKSDQKMEATFKQLSGQADIQVYEQEIK